MDTLAKRLKAERKRLKLTQAQLAKKVDAEKEQSLISNLETGTYLSSPYMPEIAHALGVDAYWLKTGKGDRTGGGKALSKDEQMLIDAFPHIESSMRKTWLTSAADALETAERQKKVA